MTVDEAVCAVERAYMVTRALCLIGSEDLKEPCFEELYRLTLGSLSEDLGTAHEALRRFVREHTNGRLSA